MSRYLVSWELTSTERDYAPFAVTLQGFGGSVRITPTTYVITTSAPMVQVANQLRSEQDVNDTLLVVDVVAGAAAWAGTDIGVLQGLEGALRP